MNTLEYSRVMNDVDNSNANKKYVSKNTSATANSGLISCIASGSIRDTGALMSNEVDTATKSITNDADKTGAVVWESKKIEGFDVYYGLGIFGEEDEMGYIINK